MGDNEGRNGAEHEGGSGRTGPGAAGTLLDDPALNEAFEKGYRYTLWKVEQERIEDEGGPDSIYPAPHDLGGGPAFQHPAIFKGDIDALLPDDPDNFDYDALPPLPVKSAS